jgi:hypothetical protein
MKKWETVVIVAFFAVFVLLFLSVEWERPWEPKTSKVGEMVIIDDVNIWPHSLLVDDSLEVNFMSEDGDIVGFKDYEAGTGWKFIILNIQVSNYAEESRSFSAGRIEDEDGMTYASYDLEDIRGIPYHSLYQYEDFVKLPTKEHELISIAYKMPINAVPEKFHYYIYNSHSRHGEIMLKK